MSYTANPDEGKRVYDLDRQYVFHSWSAQGKLNPLCVAAAEGTSIWDYDGHRYLDFSSQLVYTNLGHQHPKLIAGIKQQLDRLTTIAPQHAVDVRGEAAKKIVEVSSDNMRQVFFTNGGADGIENAIRMARLHTGRHKVLSFYRSYHGNTGAAIVATGDQRRWPNEFAMHHAHFFGPYLYRSVFHSTSPEQETERALAHLEEVIVFEGPATIAAILIESVVGTGGILVPPPGYLEGVRALCDKYGIIYIADEVMAGFGRTGTWFAYQNWDVKPDLIVFAKGSNSGYVPAGGVVISEPIAETFRDRVFPGGLTYSGHPLAMASISTAIDIMHEEGTMDNAAAIGRDILGPGLRELKERHPIVGDVRGLGVFWAVELVTNRETKEPVVPYGAPVGGALAELVGECKKNGLLPFAAGNRIHMVPPCNISEAEAKEGVVILDEALSTIDKYAEV
ncbi:MAG: aspartate aminotransferase family protein [Actinomycetales bacterium mxb001]|nr:MAG: aspartate aminotransferase family protein [Actinomycetales bacterium mxb001]